MTERSAALSRRHSLQAGLATCVEFFAFGRDFWTEAIAAPAREGAEIDGDR